MAASLRLISTDFDGTIAEPDHAPIAPAFFERIVHWRRQNAIAWVINTGRTWESLREELERRAAPAWPDFAVGVEREIWQVKGRDAVPWADWNGRCAEVHRDLFAATRDFWQLVDDFVVRHTNGQLIDDAGSPLGIIAADEEEADEISAFLSPLLARRAPLTVVRNSVYFRFAHADYHKGSCLGAIAASLGVKPEETFASGDHYNDLPMLDRRYAHHVGCPANAVDEVKAKVHSQGGHLAAARVAEGTVEALDRFFPRGKG